MKRLVLASGLALSLCAPVFAQVVGPGPGGPVPVVDNLSILKQISILQQEISLVTSAQTNLKALAGGGALTTVQGRIASVTGLLQQAQAACQGAQLGRVVPSACMVRSNVATTQAGQLGSAMAQIQGIQAAAAGAPGALAVGQAQAQATVEVATQLQQIHQMQLADAKQKQIDEALLQRVYGANGSVRP